MAGRGLYLSSDRLRLYAGTGAGLMVLCLLWNPVQRLAQRTVLMHTAREVFLLFLLGPLAAYALSKVGRLGRPVTGLVASNVVLVAWQLPGVVALTSRNPLADDVAVLVFLGAATAFWLPLLQGDRLSQIGRAGYLLVAGVPPTLPGVVLAFSRRLYYRSSLEGPPVFNLPPLKDQHLAGLLLFGSAKLVLVTAVFVVIWNMLGGEREPPDDRRGYEESPPLPPPAPAWYRRLEDELAAEPVPVNFRPVATGTPSATEVPGRRLALQAGEPVAEAPAVRRP